MESEGWVPRLTCMAVQVTDSQYCVVLGLHLKTPFIVIHVYEQY